MFRAYAANKRMLEEMTYLTEHLCSLRQEIAQLQNMNAHYSNKSERSPLDQSALELRTIRLLQIKKELTSMLARPNNIINALNPFVNRIFSRQAILHDIHRILFPERVIPQIEELIINKVAFAKVGRAF
jgi:hypothetical protein